MSLESTSISVTPTNGEAIKELSALRELYRELMALEAAHRTQKICFYKPRTKSRLGPRGIQARFHSSRAAIRLVLGDNRSGKSVSGACEAIACSLGVRPWLPKDHPDHIVRLANGDPMPVPNVGRILAQNYTQAIKQTIYAKIKEWAPLGYYKVKFDSRGIPIELNYTNGSVAYLMSDDQDDDAFEGTNGHWVWCDEPPSYNKWAALIRGLVDFSGIAWLTMTPLSQPWIADVVEARANDPDGQVEVFEFDIWDNCVENGGVLSRAAIELFISQLREDQKAARVGRTWLHLTGRVFPQWRPEEPYWVKPFEIPAHWPRVELCDPHPRKPIAIMWAAISPKNQLIIYRELYDEKLKTVDMVSDRIHEDEGFRLVRKRAGNTPPKWEAVDETENVVLRIIDTSSRQNDRTSGESIWSRFSDNNLHHNLANKQNAEAGYDAIHTALHLDYEWSEPQIVVFNTCPTVKHNFLRFVWDDWATSKQRDLKGEKQEVRKTNDDFIDLIRYIFQSGITYQQLRSLMRSNLFAKPVVKSTALWRTN